MLTDKIQQAAELLQSADAIVIGAGAGMGVDSGLPDFRGKQGFWNAYPMAKKLNLNFQDLANPQWFHANPRRAWGFYGHRYNLYKNTTPHAGFQILLSWINKAKLGGFVFTSNVDGHFQKSGFNEQQVVECHGSINHLQCSEQCTHAIWPAANLNIDIDFETLNTALPLPTCPTCGAIARPNILMFGDNNWTSDRTTEQESLYHDWLAGAQQHNLIFIEIGAGVNIPTVRYECTTRNKPYIRINPTDSDTTKIGVGIPLGGLETIFKLNNKIMHQ